MLARLPLPLLGLTLGALLDGAHAQGTPPDYAPKTNVQCPDTNKTPLIRVRTCPHMFSPPPAPLTPRPIAPLQVFTPQNQSLNANEQAYVTQREATVIRQAWSDWIGDGSALGYDLSKFNNNYSRVGIAVSGGGYRAAQYGAGVLSGLDARNDSAKAAGTGGMLQVTSYISALSGTSHAGGDPWFAG
jgi:lysophospholipase